MKLNDVPSSLTLVAASSSPSLPMLPMSHDVAEVHAAEELSCCQDVYR
jgi:hypothetical protein